MKIVFIAKRENFPKKELNRLRSYAEVIFIEKDRVDIKDLRILRQQGKKILCPFPEPFHWQFPNDLLKKIPDLQGVCLSTTSFNWIDGKFLKNRDIPLTNVPSSSTNAVSEGAIFMMLAISRRYQEFIKQRNFNFVPQNSLSEIKGKTMGIIGLGNIGSRIAELGKGLGMKVIYWSRHKKNTWCTYASLKTLLQHADFIFPTLATLPETHHFISEEEINLLKPTASLISIAPTLIDCEYAIKMVTERKIYGFAFESEEKQRRFRGNVFVTHSNNWYTQETLMEKMKVWIDCILSVIEKKPKNVVNT
jgi:lactate dehydrogenase-like 2-hydroxyacid dehydrogenase